MIQANNLEKYPDRRTALAIMEAGLSAILTKKVVNSSVSLNGDILRIKDLQIDLSQFKRIKVIGFGKVSSEVAVELEKILGPRIESGAVVDINANQCRIIENFIGTHPHPSEQNVVATKRIVELAEGLREDDLVLVIVSGGGSALLCSSEEERRQGEDLYTEFLKVGGSIKELNLVRKHTSLLKGGGLAQRLYPARVVSLVFSDIPGNIVEEVASGPTFKDESTIADAQTLLDKYGFKGFKLNETPKEDKYFERVTNISLVSNLDALRAMSDKAAELGFKPKILSSEIYDSPEVATGNFKKLLDRQGVVLGGGEVKLMIKGEGGSGGRCVQVALAALPLLEKGETFAAIASDGLDNSDAAGAIVDMNTLDTISRLNLDIGDYFKRADSYNFFEQTGDLIFTGQTGANVSDLMLWLRK